ncbi:MAG: ribosome biogenesis GTP-binding protein YihA/YsxC [Rhodospirillales bacterium]
MMRPEADEAALEAGRKLFSQQCDFLLGAATREHIPDTSLPEIAFAGRSNVGKSSLLNALTGRKTLARTSNTPGRTREINFFDLAHRLILVDLPGYGYARASKSLIKQWTGLVNDYLRGRVQLRRVALLIDARHGLKDSDEKVMAMLDTAAVSYQAVLTKADKIAAGKLDGVCGKIAAVLAKHTAAHPDIIATSARTGAGIPELRAVLSALAAESDLQ